MGSNKIKTLFIAKNIPVEGMYSSRVVIEIAHKISEFTDVTFLYPKEKVAPGIHLLKKYKPYYRLKPWNCEGYDISIYSYPRSPIKTQSFRYWNKLSKKGESFYTSKGPFDLIHAHYILPDGYLAYLFAKRYGVPYILTIRNADIKHLRNLKAGDPDFKKAQEVVCNASKVLATNLAYKEIADKLFGIDSTILPHGIEDHAFGTKPKSIESTITIVSIAKAIKRKNIDWVIKAVIAYKGSKAIKLMVVGDGPLIQEYQALAAKNPNIVFTGKLDNDKVLEMLNNSNIFALPSFDETFGMVYLEAAANFNALIGYKGEGVWGVFKDGSEMMFCSDEIEFQKQLHTLIEDDQKREELAENAFEKVETLKWKHISIKYEDIYKEVIREYNKPEKKHYPKN